MRTFVGIRDRIRRRATAWDASVSRARGVSPLELFDGEVLIAEVYGGRILERSPIQGKVRLTTKRLTFAPVQHPRISETKSSIDLQLSDIVNVRRRSRLASLLGPYPGMRIIELTTDDGATYAIQAPILEQLQQQLRHNTSERD